MIFLSLVWKREDPDPEHCLKHYPTKISQNEFIFRDLHLESTGICYSVVPGRLTYFVLWALYGTVPTIHWALIRSETYPLPTEAIRLGFSSLDLAVTDSVLDPYMDLALWQYTDPDLGERVIYDPTGSGCRLFVTLWKVRSDLFENFPCFFLFAVFRLLIKKLL